MMPFTYLGKILVWYNSLKLNQSDWWIHLSSINPEPVDGCLDFVSFYKRKKKKRKLGCVIVWSDVTTEALCGLFIYLPGCPSTSLYSSAQLSINFSILLSNLGAFSMILVRWPPNRLKNWFIIDVVRLEVSQNYYT